MSSPEGGPQLNADERRLAELGYKQELERSWSGFTNFAISFSIISILAGCFTTYGQAWNNGGPVAISWGWPVLSILILIIAFCMAEVLSSMPTAGGIYYWAAKLGGPGWGWFTGWFNLVGLLGVVASVDYACAQFLSITIGLFDTSWHATLHNVFFLFICILILHALLNMFPAHILSVWNNTSAYWHVIGPAIVVLILIFGPSSHASASFVFTKTFNNSGFFSGHAGGFGFWFYVLPLGFLLTQYTITGYDASAHLSEETNLSSMASARGLYRSVLYSAIGGWILLLAFTFAARNVDAVNTAAASKYLGFTVVGVFDSALGLAAFKTIMVISTIGQFFCGGSGLTSASRMLYAFSRDGAVPGHQLWAKVASNKAPRNATIGMAVACAIVSLPALKGNSGNYPFAFYALTAITVIGLYIAYVIPVYLRWRMGDAFVPGPWTLGKHYKWMCPIAVIEVIVVCIYFSAPFSPEGIPGHSGFSYDNGLVQYAPVVVFGVLALAGIWWLVSAKNWFTGPRRTIDMPTPASGD